jgi:predicted enzyme related to lactoylglutathione lyase
MVPGTFIWHELMTTDPEAAIGFYQKTIGWGVMPWQQDPNYRMFMWNGVPMAGLMLLPEQELARGARPYWLSYIAVTDVDAAVIRAGTLGAKTYLEPMDIPTVGRVAVLADPQGAVFGVYRPAQSGADSDALVLGDFSWHELGADDWKSAWEFYRAMFGWEHESQFDMGDAGPYWMFRRQGGSRALGGMFSRFPGTPAASWVPYAYVRNADRAAELAQTHGGRIANGPMDVPGGGRIAQILDPQGGAFAVHSAAAARPEPTAAPSVKQPTVAKPAPKPARKAPASKPVAKKPAVKKAPASKPAAKKLATPKGRPVKKATAKKAVTPKGRPAKKSAARKAATPKGRPVKKAARRT